MVDYLDRVIQITKIAVNKDKKALPQKEIERKLYKRNAFFNHIRTFERFKGQYPTVKIIAEIKKASPSKGVLVPTLDIPLLVKSYVEAGAFAISILTQPYGFLGNKFYLSQARGITDIPILRKDFVVDPYQIYETALLKADLILFIVKILKKDEIVNFVKLAIKLGLLPLVEIHDMDDYKKVGDLEGPLVLGMNARNLKTLEVDHSFIEAILPEALEQFLVVIESGIHERKQIVKYLDKGVCAFLIGESILRSEDPRAMIQHFIT